MRLRLLILIANICFFQSALAQKHKIKFGKFSEEEVSMQSFAADPGAAAVVLYDKGEFSQRFSTNSGFIFEYERHLRIKIFKKEALNYADVRIFFYNDEKVIDLQASSFNLENGEMVETKISKDNIFDEKVTKTRRLKKLTIPGVREGSIIEYKYTVTNVSYDIPNWTFQRLEIPVVWSEYKASIPSFFEFSKLSQGEIQFVIADVIQKDNTTSGLHYYTTEIHFAQENIPALKPEPFMTAETDYLSQINFDIRAVYKPELQAGGNAYSYRLINGAPLETRRSWEKLGEELLDDVYATPLNSEKFTESIAITCTAGKTSTAEKIASIYEYIGKNYQSNGYDWIWMSQTMEKLTKDKKGTPSELNLLMINILRRAGIQAFPVAISTRDHGRILSFRVTLDAFDRIITAVENDDKSLTLIDASAWPYPPGMLPEKDLNQEGLLLRDNTNISWVPLQNKANVRSAFQSDLTIGENGVVSGKVNFSETGYGAVWARIRTKSKNAETYVKERYPDLFVDGNLSNISLENLDAWLEPNVKGTFEYVSEGMATASGNKIYFVPALGLGLKENPFKNPERKYAIDLGTPFSVAYSLTYHLPPGYKVEEAPKAAKLTFGENGMFFDYFTEIGADNIRVNIRRSVKQPNISVENYADLQQFYGTIVSKLQEQVVLTKL
ncbi:MAG: DUF3857 and transglutaminase domain-containing protein [Saprospiraceae bacterium]|nr:DUF3857 and transglutaminase domain-containing protein [Saprospiraceae bacterium]